MSKQAHLALRGNIGPFHGVFSNDEVALMHYHSVVTTLKAMLLKKDDAYSKALVSFIDTADSLLDSVDGLKFTEKQTTSIGGGKVVNIRPKSES